MTVRPSGAAAASPRIYDPWLDPRCRRLAQPSGPAAGPSWIWLPGQRAAHLHAAAMRAAVARCVNIGYPGRFRQPSPTAYFRVRGTMPAPAVVRWTVPGGRALVTVNGRTGNVTMRSTRVGAGKLEILVALDFVQSLPALYVDAGPLSTPAGWQASLDGERWVAAESEPRLGDGAALPDVPRDAIVAIPVDRATVARDARAVGEGYEIAPGGEVVLDFFHDELGSVALEVSGVGRLSLGVGESAAEAQDRATGSAEQHQLATLTLTQEPAAHLLPERCLRYLRISSDGGCRVQRVELRARVAVVEQVGRFACSDPLLDRVWAAGAATVHSCMHELYLDGLRRDALPWSFDGVAAVQAGDCLFFDAASARQTIVTQLLPDHPRRDAPGIVDFPLYAILGFELDYEVRRDLGFAAQHRERIGEILDLYLAARDEHGFVSGRAVGAWGLFPDWAAASQEGPEGSATAAYAQMLLVRALEVGAAFGRRLGDDKWHRRYSEAARALRAAIVERFWDRERTVMVNGLRGDGTPDGRASSYAQVWAILLDLVPPAAHASLFARVLDRPERRTFSLSQHFEALAYVRAGRVGAYLERLRSVWGRQLDAGASRFAEDLRPHDDARAALSFYGRPYGNSLCHAWAGAVPVVTLSRGVLGLWPEADGAAQLTVRPRLGGLTWASGVVPTPWGPVAIDVQRRRGVVTLPRGVTARLAGKIPRLVRGPGRFDLEA